MASYREENPGRNKYLLPPPPRPLCAYVAVYERHGRPKGGAGTPKILISISATNPTYILTKKLYIWIPNCIHFKNIV